MKHALFSGFLCIVAGALIGLSAQAAKYLLPDPDTRVIVCIADDDGVKDCEPAAELLRRAQKRHAK